MQRRLRAYVCADLRAGQGQKRKSCWLPRNKIHSERAPFLSHLISLEIYVSMLLHYREHLTALEKQMDALANELEEYKIIQSIPGIGEKIAATIISEIGEIDRFNHPKKLVAFAGVDPSVHISGKFTATINRITKRGSSRLRHSLFLAVLCSLRRSGSKKMKAFYEKKITEGKPYKVTMIACVNKLLHWIFALLKRKKTFFDLAYRPNGGKTFQCGFGGLFVMFKF